MTATPPKRRPPTTRRDCEVKDNGEVRALIDAQVIRFLSQRYSSQLVADYLGMKASTVRRILLRLDEQDEK